VNDSPRTVGKVWSSTLDVGRELSAPLCFPKEHELFGLCSEDVT
jgi:hypothetical protein